MKKLLKNAFFTFSRSRITMFFLALLMFLSTMTFTILSSSASALGNSYANVANNGRLHDFTVKQKYSINGNVQLKTPFVFEDEKHYYFQVVYDFDASTGNYKNRDFSNKYATIIGNEFSDLVASTNKFSFPLYSIAKADLNLSKETKLRLQNAPSKRKVATISELIKDHPKIATLLNNVKSQIDNFIYENFENDFKKTVANEHGLILDSSKVESIAINLGAKAYKLVNVAKNNHNVNKLVIFSGANISQPLDPKKLETRANARLMQVVGFASIRQEKATAHKGYKATAYYDKTSGAILSPYSYTDPSALMAIVSPSYYKENNLVTISPSEVEKIYENSLEKSKLHDPFFIMQKTIIANYKNSVIWVDSTPYFIIGVGTTPDFSFPIIDQTNPIPDTKNQAVLFVNDNGYKRITDAFRNNPREDYLAYKFKDNISEQKQNAIISFVEKTANQKMTWGKNVDKIVSRQKDTSESVIMAPYRISTLANLQKTIKIVTYSTLILLTLFVAFVIILVVKRQIDDNKKALGILLANGYTKLQIALANTSISLIIGFFSTIFGYILGVAFQPAFILIFKDYWTLPIEEITFDILSLLYTVVTPILGISFLAFVITRFGIKGQISDLITGASLLSRNLNSKFVNPLKIVGIRTRTALALAFANLPKMFLVFLSITSSTVVISNSLSIYNKFNVAQIQTSASTNYEYKLNLANPTAQGGLMKMLPIEKIGIGDIKDAKNIHSNNVNDQNLFAATVKETYEGKSKFLVPNLKNDQNSKTPFNLDGIVQDKALLNVFVGLGSFGVGPWQIVEKIMPENQLNQANLQYDNFINYTANLEANQMPQKISQKSLTQTLQDIGYLTKNANSKYIVLPGNFKKINAISQASFTDPKQTTKLYQILKKFVFNGYRAVIKLYNDPTTSDNLRLANMPFFLSYRNIIANRDDETFTRIEGRAKLVSKLKAKGNKKLDIIGIKPTTQFINFDSQALKKLINFQNQDVVPVIANQFFLFQYNKEIGDTFFYEVANHKNRFLDNYKAQTIKIKIVGIHNSYASSKLYTLQKKAIATLGWDTNDKDEKKMFNGIFTKHKQSILFKSISLYSLSGFYPATGTIITNSPIATNIAKYLQANKVSGISDFNTLKRKFTLSPYVMVYKDVNWRYTNENRFNAMSDISRQIVFIIQAITLILVILFILIISMMIVYSSKKFISTMRVIGYRSQEIGKIFFTSFIPALILGIALAGPISLFAIDELRYAIAYYSEVYVPISLTWWLFIIAALITTTILGVVYFLATRNLRKTSLQKAFT